MESLFASHATAEEKASNDRDEQKAEKRRSRQAKRRSERSGNRKHRKRSKLQAESAIEEPVPESEPAPPPPVAPTFLVPFVPSAVVVPSSSGASAKPTAVHRPREGATGLLFGVSGGGMLPLSGPMDLGVDGRLELGLRFKRLQRAIGLSIAPSVLYLWSSKAPNGADGVNEPDGSDVVGKATTLGVTLPILASLNLEAGRGLVRMTAGPSLNALATTVRDLEGRHENRTLTLGGEVGAGYLFRSPLGYFGAMGEGRLLPFRYDNVPHNPVMVGVRLIYLGDRHGL